ncbi:hemerythrin domain-containing protein [Sphingobium phenoxybenzoativorans]|uniref:Hemerythrin domain-containing protein n=1 Tax=Sphingobium phenoxybenzoativorans TaxID=1592790 RepID=A0A975K3J8_9SPHN|nr:hemerythrin domain-containing protein [Sphingobium phenoxybenzoativorans]QUT04245.1 hemerythrin domain-containing protein [Sphingobium phenoxybenzoativorans]
MIERLLQDHDKMRSLAKELSEILSQPYPADLDHLAELRWDMASTIMTHLAFEDRAFYSKIEADPREHVRVLALKFRAELSEKFREYSAHTRNWTPARLQMEWSAYRACALEFLNWLIDRADREEKQLFPLITTGMVDSSSRNLTSVNWAREAFAMKDAIVGI